MYNSVLETRLLRVLNSRLHYHLRYLSRYFAQHIIKLNLGLK